MDENADTADPANQSSSTALPLPAIICISIGAYLVFIVILLVIRSLLLRRGLCLDTCNCCGKEGNPGCCECWINCAESCACKNPNIEACLDSICPNRKQMDCVDIILCQCCSDPNNSCCTCCNAEDPLCDCGACNCQCQAPECEDINCFCFKLKTKAPPPDAEDLET